MKYTGFFIGLWTTLLFLMVACGETNNPPASPTAMTKIPVRQVQDVPPASVKTEPEQPAVPTLSESPATTPEPPAPTAAPPAASGPVQEAPITPTEPAVESAAPASEPSPASPEAAAPKPVKEAPAPENISHEIWHKLLQQHVSSAGKVNYEGFKQDQAKLQSYLSLLANRTPEAGWSRAQKMAYWINAYNAFTVKLIVDNYPLKSIRKLDKPWDTRFIKLGGKSYSLNDIEHEILRKKYKDPRIHFAVNCASISCPKLLNTAFQPNSLESQLERQTRSFINNAQHNTLEAKAIEISQLFNWYKDDFTKEGTVIDYLNRYATTQIAPDASISYKEYNWNLNN